MVLTPNTCQAIQEKCIILERENSELSSTLKTTQGTKVQISERLRRNEDALREAEQSLLDVQSREQDSSRALENEKRAHALLQTELSHLKEFLNIEKKRREEAEMRQQHCDDQASELIAGKKKHEEEIALLRQNLRHRKVEGQDFSQHADRSDAQVEELQIATGLQR